MTESKNIFMHKVNLTLVLSVFTGANQALYCFLKSISTYQSKIKEILQLYVPDTCQCPF